MKLSYIWIKNYGVINNQGFNFEPNVKYEFDEKTGILSKEDSPQIPADFFTIENNVVNNVTAIIGANGTGKSSVLELIASFLCGERPLAGFVITDSVIVNKSDIAIAFSADWQGAKPNILSRKDLVNAFRKKEHLPQLPDGVDTLRSHEAMKLLGNYFSDTKLIFYSGEPTYQYTAKVYQDLLALSSSFENSYFVDISDMGMIANDQSSYRSDTAVYSGENPIIAHKSGESERLLNMILSPEKTFIPFDVDHLNISVSFNDIDTTFFTSYDEIAFKPLLQILHTFFAKEGFIESNLEFVQKISDNGIGGFFLEKVNNKELATNDIKELIRLNLYHRVLLRHVREQIIQTLGELSEPNKLPSIFDLIIDIEKHFNNQADYINQIQAYLAHTKFGINYVGRLNTQILEDFLSFLFSNTEIELDKSSISIPLSKNITLKELAKQLHTINSTAGPKYILSKIFDFEFRGLSTGEKQFLKLFSRFINYSLNNIKEEKSVTNYLILVDEFEIGFHPLWQRKFLSTLISFLEGYINQDPTRRKINIQLVITSHSPFIVSDLPKQCINFLQKENNKTVIDNFKRHHLTFGANIHALFTDAFFLENGLMGDFAQLKIDKLIKEIFAKEKFTIKEYDYYKTRIEMIGEAFIKIKLLEKIAAGMDQIEVDILISDRERELMHLKEIRDNK